MHGGDIFHLTVSVSVKPGIFINFVVKGTYYFQTFAHINSPCFAEQNARPYAGREFVSLFSLCLHSKLLFILTHLFKIDQTADAFALSDKNAVLTRKNSLR
jgi:hypothetical protein